jgi:lia operon protein LiaG
MVRNKIEARRLTLGAQTMFSRRFAFALLLAVPAVMQAQRVERFTLRGNRAAVYNIAGKVTIEAGTGADVVVEVTRAGKDADRLKMEERTIEGRSALCVIYPDERIIYRDRQTRANSNWSTNTSSDGECQGGGRRFLGGRRIEVRSQGDGVEAWADIRVLVPAGRDVRVWEVVGNVDAANVDGTLDIDVAAATVSTRGTRGQLIVDAGSGNVSVGGHRGNVSVDVGSGNVVLSDVESKSISVDAGSGRLSGTNVTADDLSLDTGSGTVSFSGITAKRVMIDTGSGAADLGFVTNVETLDVDTGSGSVTLAMPANFSAEINISTGSGGVQSDFPVSNRRGDRNELRGTVGGGRGRVCGSSGVGDERLKMLYLKVLSRQR